MRTQWIVVMAIASICGCGRLGFNEQSRADASFECLSEGSACEVGAARGVCLAGQCCTGCISGDACVSGREADACGLGGGQCIACGDDAFCEIGFCEAGAESRRMGLGFEMSCLISQGRLYCAGRNDVGQLGDGSGADSALHIAVGSNDDWFAVSAGEQHTCGLRGEGELYCWGLNAEGQLLLGDTISRDQPTRVGSASDWTALDTGHDFTCARNRAGEIHCGGDNTEGQIGQGSRNPAFIPTLTQVGTDGGWASFGLGRGHACAIRNGGELHCWGANDSNQQGHAAGEDAPTIVPGPTGWTTVIAGSRSTCGFRAGELLCWGDNVDGLFALGDELERPTPEVVTSALGAWSSYIFHACGIDATRGLQCAGRAIEGQLGTNDTQNQVDLVKPTIGLNDWVEVATGRFFTCARRRSGALYCSGANDFGQLGLGDTVRRRGFEPIIVSD